MLQSEVQVDSTPVVHRSFTEPQMLRLSERCKKTLLYVIEKYKYEKEGIFLGFLLLFYFAQLCSV